MGDDVTPMTDYVDARSTFHEELASIVDQEGLLDFCRRKALHGTPIVFQGNEDNYYQFRKRIANRFSIHFHEVFIVGSAKYGFSPHKDKAFDYDSDIDVAIVSSSLYDKIMWSIRDYQMQLRENRKTVSESEIKCYHLFLEYGAMGWIRPDLLPLSFRLHELRENWFDFFASISYGKSEVGNYKVSAGAFKSHHYFECYILSHLSSLQSKLRVEKIHGSAN